MKYFRNLIVLHTLCLLVIVSESNCPWLYYIDRNSKRIDYSKQSCSHDIQLKVLYIKWYYVIIFNSRQGMVQVCRIKLLV